MSKQVNYNENLCSGAAIRDDKGRRISKLFEASHPKMTVGYAKNLIMPNDPTEQEFNFRQSGGGVIEDGVAVIDKVKGNSVVWNQSFNRGSIIDIIGMSVTYNQATKFYDCRGNNTESQIRSIGIYSANFKSGDIIMRIAITKNFNVKNVDANKINCNNLWNATQKKDGGRIIYRKVGLLSVAISEVIGNNGDKYNCYYDIDVDKVALREETDTFSFSYAVYNLTQMFGAGNEPTTYEEFLQRKPKVADEFAYNEGTIVNNKVEKVVTTGKNIWDEQWELGAYYSSTGEKLASSNQIRSKNMFACLPHTSYYWRIPNKANGTYMGNCFFYDISGAFISKSPIGPTSYLTVTTPSNARFVAFGLRGEYGTTYNHDICINLSDPAINGQYFPYEKHELDIAWVKDIKDADGVKLFEDGMRSAGTAFDEAGKGRAIKRIGVMDMGKMSWSIREDISPSMFASYGVAPNNKIGLCPIASINKNQYGATLVDGTLYWMGTYIMMYNSKFTTIDDFVNFVSGVPIYYELAEPIEVEYDEKNLTYPVVAGGTEEAIASEPSTAFRADIGYGIDAVKTILDLKARVEALEGK